MSKLKLKYNELNLHTYAYRISLIKKTLICILPYPALNYQFMRNIFDVQRQRINSELCKIILFLGKLEWGCQC